MYIEYIELAKKIGQVKLLNTCKRQDSNLGPYFFQPYLLPIELRRWLAATFVNYGPGVSVAAINWPNYSSADFCSREVDASVDCFTIDCQAYIWETNS